MTQLMERIAKLSPGKRALLASRLQAQGEAGARSGMAEPIAVIGMGCRLPGGINSPEAFWQALCDGVDAVTEIPASRWDVDKYYDPSPGVPGRMNTRWGGFIDDIDKFDAQFFGISPREASSMDPQQRLLLEVSWDALEHAGQATHKLAGSLTGIFVGICRNDYGQLHGVVEDPTRIDAYFGTGNASSFAAGRVSYLLGLHGPSLAVDTACSSSLVAVHLACQSLHTRECHMALAGGVNLILSPTVNIYLSQLRTFAPDGRCKVFDDKADGYVRGEGCGMVVLKRLSDALADGDDILAVIRGSAINQDGRSAGLTAPNGPAQEAVIRSALANAGVDPLEVGFVEAHGTGTSLGDPIEMRALGAVFGRGRERQKPLVIGSVKTNLGHLEAAAGVAGLIKLVLATQHGEIPKQIHFNEPSSYIPWQDLPVVIPTERLPWASANNPRIGSVSSFGFSGTNAHIVLEESPTARESHTHSLSISESRSQSRASTEPALRPEPALYLLPLSARHPQALLQLAHSYLSLLGSLTQTTPAASTALLRDLCYSASLRRSHHRPHRLAALASSPAQLQRLLSAFVSDQPSASLFSSPGASQRSPALSAPAPKVVFIFSGQGAQWWGMGRYLLSHSRLFRQTIEECDRLLRAHTGEWSLLEELLADEQSSRIDGEALEITQVCLFAVQVGLARLWQSYGVEPFAVIGHSMGEVAAAAVAGKLTLSEAVRVIYERSRLLQEVAGSGAMAAVELSGEEAGVLVRGKGGRVSVAAVNGRRASVISGEREAVQEMVRELEERGVMAREVRSGGVGGHSGEVERLREELKEALGGLQESEGRGERREREREEGERAGSEGGRAEQSEASRREQSKGGRGEQRGVMMISTVEVREVESEELGAGYWWRNMREGVRFGEAVREAARKGAGVYVEMNAHPVLGLWVREAAQEVAQEVAAGQEAGERQGPRSRSRRRGRRRRRVWSGGDRSDEEGARGEGSADGGIGRGVCGGSGSGMGGGVARGRWRESRRRGRGRRSSRRGAGRGRRSG